MVALEARPSVSRREVPYFDYRSAFSCREEEYIDVIRDVMRRGAFILQEDVARFERHLADYLGVSHALGLANCTDALIIALRALSIEPGDEVIFPSHTMVATPSAAFFVGATPVPVDVCPDGLIDPDSVEAAITPRTRAIMPVQLNGRTCKMDRLQAIADRHGLTIVEDAAQGLGSKYRGRYAGTFGAAAAYSFYPAKILGCMGDGGALVTNDPEVDRKVRLLRDHGRTDAGDVDMWGLNSRLDNLHAAILDLQFRDYGHIISRRRAIARIYQERLGGLEELQLPPAPDSDPDHFDVYQNYEIQASRRDSLRAYLKEHGVGTLLPWGGKAVHQFERLGFGEIHLPVTERLFQRFLMLPMNMMLSDTDVEFVCDTIQAFYRG